MTPEVKRVLQDAARWILEDADTVSRMERLLDPHKASAHQSQGALIRQRMDLLVLSDEQKEA